MSLEQDDRFAAALEECCRRVRAGEELERCLTDYPAAYREELARLAPLVGPLGAARRDPAPEFQARLERRLLDAVDEERRRRRVGPLEKLGRFFTTTPLLRTAAVVLVLIFVLVGGGVGVIQAADDSLPDSPLYHVKTAHEWVELALARDGESKVGVQARQLQVRGRELERAVRTRRSPAIVGLLELAVAQSTRRIVDQALELQARGNSQPAARALAALRAMERQVDLLSGEAAPEVRAPLHRLRTFFERQEQRLSGQSVTVS